MAAAVSTGGGAPAAARRAATSALSAFTTSAPPTVEPGATGVSRPGTRTIASPAGAPVSSVRSAKSWSFLPAGWRDSLASLCARNNRNHTHAALLETLGDFDRNHVAARRRDHERRVLRGQVKIAKDSLCEATHIFEEHRLPLTVRPHHEVVEGQRQFHDGIEPGE